MKEYRSASQILFGFLPEQTVDLKGGIWKISRWRTPLSQRDVDIRTLRAELIRYARAWAEKNMDGGFVKDLERNHPLRVYSLDKENGIEAQQFPRNWECKKCHRLYTDPNFNCECGSKGRPGQMHFVGYCELCGTIKSPYLPVCSVHKQRRVVWPETASAIDIRFECPVCEKLLRKGLGVQQCSCGGSIKHAVHRAASVYTPRSIVIVNPPSQDKIRAISEAGGRPRALAWVVNGMVERTVTGAPSTREAIRKTLAEQGLSAEQIELMLTSFKDDTDASYITPEGLADPAKVEQEAVSLALATIESRTTVDDLVKGADSSPDLHNLYTVRYPKAFAKAGVEAVELLDKFPVLTGMYGYTRGKYEPGASRLVAHRVENQYAVLADIADTEALLIRLDPVRVGAWLSRQGYVLDEASSAKEWRHSIVKAVSKGDSVSKEIGDLIYKLVHSYSHRLIRLSAVYGGIDMSALSELVLSTHLSFIMYAAARGDFVLGGLQALFEGELDQMLDAFCVDDHRCPLDPGCLHGGAACMACLHLGEPSCRDFNQRLSRSMLIGSNGYLSM